MQTPHSSPIRSPPALRRAINEGRVTTRRGPVRRLRFADQELIRSISDSMMEDIIAAIDENHTRPNQEELAKLIQQDCTQADATCGICLEDNKLKSTKCGHHFHKRCLISWLMRNNSCPSCRAKLY